MDRDVGQRPDQTSAVYIAADVGLGRAIIILFQVADKFGGSHLYGGKSYDESYLNGKMEKFLENNVDYDNIYHHSNPYSRSMLILNRRGITKSLANPAVFITDKDKFSYDEINSLNKSKNEQLKGTVVLFMKNAEEAKRKRKNKKDAVPGEIEIFYLDMEGIRSEFVIGV